MSADHKTPANIARGLAKRARTQAASGEGAWQCETYTLERGEARVKAAAYFAKFPKAAYMTEIESWRELSGGRIEFTPPAQRRLTARAKERCFANATCLRTARQTARSCLWQRRSLRRSVAILKSIHCRWRISAC
jgi:hypothetical protein